MSIIVEKRIIEIASTKYEVLLPINEVSEKRLHKLPVNKPVEITIKRIRDYLRLQQYWTLIDFYMSNLPEHRDKELGEYVQADNKKAVNTWLKFSVGFVETIIVNGETKQIPKALNFHNEKNEDVIETEYYWPLKQFLSTDMGYDNTFKLVKASLEFKNRLVD